MKKLGAFLTMISLLSLVPAAFALDSSGPVYRSGARSPVGREASDVPSSQARNTSRSADETWHAGDLRPSGLYMGPDGVLHNVPKTQDPRLRIY
jgi:hypothetical protein